MLRPIMKELGIEKDKEDMYSGMGTLWLPSDFVTDGMACTWHFYHLEDRANPTVTIKLLEAELIAALQPCLRGTKWIDDFFLAKVPEMQASFSFFVKQIHCQVKFRIGPRMDVSVKDGVRSCLVGGFIGNVQKFETYDKYQEFMTEQRKTYVPELQEAESS